MFLCLQVCCLDTAVGLVYRDSVGQPDAALKRILSPAATFIQFVRAVSHEPDVLLDLLVSNETCFLLYLLRTLKFVRRNWEEFVQECGGGLDNVMTMLIRLRLAIDRLVCAPPCVCTALCVHRQSSYAFGSLRSTRGPAPAPP